jgi:hypothetical protein
MMDTAMRMAEPHRGAGGSLNEASRASSATVARCSNSGACGSGPKFSQGS